MNDYNMIKVELPAPIVLVQYLPYTITQLYQESHGFDPINCDGCAMKQLAIRGMADALEAARWGLRGEVKRMVEAILRGELPDEFAAPV